MSGFSAARAVLPCILILIEIVAASNKATSESGKVDVSLPENVGTTPTLEMAKQLIEHQKQLMAEQNALLKRLENLNVPAAVSEGSNPLQQCNGTKEPEVDPDDEGFPFVSLTVLLIGCGCLIKLLHTEMTIFAAKLTNESEVQKSNILVGEFLQYRLDY